MKVQLAEAVIVNQNKVLLVQQRKKSAYGLWSFPGGHIESGESPEDAVHRETREELGADLINTKLFKVHDFDSDEGLLEFHTFTGQLNGEISLNEEELMTYGYFSLEELEGMESKLRAPIIPNVVQEILESSLVQNGGEL